MEDTRDSILQRLSALSSTDSLIEAAQGQGASLQDIVTIELVPYDVSRVSIAGEQVFLPPKLALVFALLFHELATNAAKYGALSIPSGQVSICWSLVDKKLALNGGKSVVQSLQFPHTKGLERGSFPEH